MLRGAPSLPGQPAGGSSFGNFNSQQNSAFVARAFSSVHPRPFFKPPSMVSNHFQLASANAFGGTNPFSPSLSVRTRSMDGFGEPKIIEQVPRAHSAPIVPQIRGESCFQFPSRTNPQFYLPRIKVGMLIYHFQVEFDICSDHCSSLYSLHCAICTLTEIRLRQVCFDILLLNVFFQRPLSICNYVKLLILL